MTRPLAFAIVTKALKIQVTFYLYATQRATLLGSVNEILHKVGLNHLETQSQLYLYGDSTINNSDNKNIILATIKYIKETRRFST